VLISLLFANLSYAEDETYKHSLLCDMRQIYNEDPQNVDSLTEMFCNGIYYGRLRSNSFLLSWKDEVSGKREDSAILAIGGSMIYKSAYLHGFAVSAGLYTTHAKGSLAENESYLYKAGKDTFSRYNLLSGDSGDITSLSKAYIEYKYEQSYIRYGRQNYTTFLTKSNDTKMIPNSFEGMTLVSKIIPNTVIQVAYFLKQKLRDHANFHHIFAYGDSKSDPYSMFTQNDDSAMHRGITLSKLREKNIKDRLFVFEAKNRSIDNLALRINYTAVPKLISYMMLQAEYIFEIDDWSMIPGFRYMKQFDDGAGSIAGSNLREITDGYTNPNKLDATLYGARVDIVNDAFKLRVGYTKVADEADMVTPWRGFPTAGFTRAMSQYNWYANTQSYMLQLDYEFENISDFKILSRFVVQDFDDKKTGVQADSKVFTFDAIKSFPEHSISLKTRFAHVVGDEQSIEESTFVKPNPSYDEIRFEINYLF
jgi:hypothetical protein